MNKLGFGRKDDYVLLEHPDLPRLRASFTATWQKPSLPAIQWRRVERELEDWQNVPVFSSLLALLRLVPAQHPRVLEVGCSSGYYSEVLRRANYGGTYEGCDYSESFINLARERYPQTAFRVEDATALTYADESFDIVISGCCILHIIDYPKAIAESARVASSYVIFHRTPTLHQHPTAFLTKRAYDTDMLEIFFNEEELFDHFRAAGLSVVGVRTIAVAHRNIKGLSEPVCITSYLCKKNAP